ncbi:hypothetical protein EV182_005740, partial [Spiromyces aspiralis]
MAWNCSASSLRVLSLLVTLIIALSLVSVPTAEAQQVVPPAGVNGNQVAQVGAVGVATTTDTDPTAVGTAQTTLQKQQHAAAVAAVADTTATTTSLGLHVVGTTAAKTALTTTPTTTAALGVPTTSTSTTQGGQQIGAMGGGGNPQATVATPISSLITTATGDGTVLDYSDCNQFISQCYKMCRPYKVENAECANGGTCVCNNLIPMSKLSTSIAKDEKSGSDLVRDVKKCFNSGL